jgi:hypothetical protein
VCSSLSYSRIYWTSGNLSLPTFNRTLSANPDLVNFSGQKNLFTDGPSSIDINTNVQLSVGISAVAAGKIIPPQVSQFGITYGMLYRICSVRPSTIIDHVDDICVGLNGNADAKLSFSPGSTSGPISSANVTLFQSDLPGFSFPKYVAAVPRPQKTDSSSRLIVVSLISLPNVRYWAGSTPISEFKM